MTTIHTKHAQIQSPDNLCLMTNITDYGTKFDVFENYLIIIIIEIITQLNSVMICSKYDNFEKREHLFHRNFGHLLN